MVKDVFRAFDRMGNIALVKFSEGTKVKDKRKFANKLLKQNKAIKTVLEKTGKFKGRLRKQTTKHVAGEKTKEALYKENGCVFRFNVDSTYFSPRLSNERKEIAGKIKKGEDVLVMFAGVSPFSIVIAKMSKARKVYSNEINREANKYAKLNIELNKLKGKVVLLPGDIKRNVGWEYFYPTKFKIKDGKKVAVRGKWLKVKYDVIVMPRPQLKNSFLKEAFSLSKKGTRIYYYDFCKHDEKKEVVEKIKAEAKKARKKIKILGIKNAGEIAPYKFRVRVDFKVL
ncbi:MAG TPA: hypothetical protein ENH99_01345 [Candidatus Pacearchaeota archaeon]|nr:hypothetical protein [Candidatus Pacearchaeota archaeon]